MNGFRFLAVVTLALGFSSTASAQTYKSDAPLVFKSRASVKKKLGPEVADQIPESFNFSIHALVWSGMEYEDGATLKIETLPAVNNNQMRRHSPSIWFNIKRLTAEVAIDLQADSPCAGGMAKSQEMMRECYESTAAGEKAAKKVITLFATPKAKLKRAKMTTRRMQPRP